jgi:hypothetical protein
MITQAARPWALVATIGLFGLAALSALLAVIGGLTLLGVLRASDLLAGLSGFIPD